MRESPSFLVVIILLGLSLPVATLNGIPWLVNQPTIPAVALLPSVECDGCEIVRLTLCHCSLDDPIILRALSQPHTRAVAFTNPLTIPARLP